VTLPVALALLALLVAAFALVAVVAVLARVRVLEAGRAAEVSGYGSLTGRLAPVPVVPRPGQRLGLVAVLDPDCALCHVVLDALGAVEDPDVRIVAVTPFPTAPRDGIEMLSDAAVRAALYEGYAPTLLALDAAGAVTRRHFVHADTDVTSLVADLTGRVAA
jgi:hypothetical protein